MDKMDLWNHLGELRKRVFIGVIAWFILTLGSFSISSHLIDDLARPIGRLIILTPGEALASQLKLAGLLGLLGSLPIILYQLGAFLWPGMTGKERRVMLFIVPGSLLCFYGGLLFGYIVIFPMTLQFLLQFSKGQRELAISVANYLSFLLQVVLPCGIVFQLPLFLTGLGRLGIVNGSLLRRGRKYSVLASAMLAALLTPPDLFSQLLLACPLILLYELSIRLTDLLTLLERRSSNHEL